MSESQKELKMSILKHRLTDTESLHVFHLENTLAHYISLDLLFHAEVPGKNSKKLHLPLPSEALLPFQFR